MVLPDRFASIANATKQFRRLFITKTSSLRASSSSLKINSVTTTTEQLQTPSNSSSFCFSWSTNTTNSGPADQSDPLAASEETYSTVSSISEDDTCERLHHLYRQDQGAASSAETSIVPSRQLSVLSAQVLELISEMKPEDVVPELVTLMPRLEAYATRKKN
ncbi:hypothetical protein VTP01DRAFT_8599 [Rhizomucor pusillus]|uniref:uncharacterized protein n=1 Tax=Rhizomucor pusillus TaxID=4840 RepID=UPI0037436B22